MIRSSSQNTDTAARNIVVKDGDHEEEEVDELPGFRFHPTDEELLGFYLRRKVDKKRLSIELIKQIDIYKFDPWDLPKTSTSPDKEGYFFCKRGRKYKNSIRPNRVTGSGFWKATGIDKQVYSLGGEGQDCIGLKKTLVYYRGSAGKGTKTDWMMHEFRLPSSNDNGSGTSNNAKINLQEAEVWTICRIFKRNVSQRKLNTPDWRSADQSKRNSTVLQPSSGSIITCSADTSNIHQHEGYISFEAPVLHQQIQTNQKPIVNHHHHHQQHINQTMTNIPYPVSSADQQLMISSSSIVHTPPPPPSMGPSSSTSFLSNNPYGNDHHLFTYDQNWDELRSSVVDFDVKEGTYGAAPVQVNPMRFRPNLVISGGETYAEDGWRNLKIGNQHFTSLGGCNRCQMINFVHTDEQVQKSNEPLATLASYRRAKGKILFGILLKNNTLEPDTDSYLEVGQEVHPNSE